MFKLTFWTIFDTLPNGGSRPLRVSVRKEETWVRENPDQRRDRELGEDVRSGAFVSTERGLSISEG